MFNGWTGKPSGSVVIGDTAEAAVEVPTLVSGTVFLKSQFNIARYTISVRWASLA